MKRPGLILLTICLGFFPVPVAECGPCDECVSASGPVVPAIGFWDEVNVSNLPGESVDPDIAVAVSPSSG